MMGQNVKIALVLTATVEVAVKGGNFTSAERFKMYTDTLRFYAKALGRTVPVYIVENSNADIRQWSEEFRESMDLHVVQYRPEDPLSYSGFDPSKGKGYNEYLMIKKLIGRLDDADVTHFMKITGRYAMLNVKSMLAEARRKILSRGYVFIGDVKDTNIYKLIGRKDTMSHAYGDSRFFVANVKYWHENLSDCYLEMNDSIYGKWAEDYIFNLSRAHRNDGAFCFRFRTQVLFNGISGTLSSKDISNRSLQGDSFRGRAKAAVRQLGRWLIPFVWF